MRVHFARLAFYHTCFHFSVSFQISHLHAFDDFFPHHFVIAKEGLMMDQSFDCRCQPLRKVAFSARKKSFDLQET
jgi:hypothetical protein